MATSSSTLELGPMEGISSTNLAELQSSRPHGLEFALTCTVNCGTLYRQVLAIPNHVQSIEFITGGLQLSYRNISRYQWKQNAPQLTFG